MAVPQIPGVDTPHVCLTGIDSAWGCTKNCPVESQEQIHVAVDEHGGTYEHDLLSLLEQKESFD